MVTNLLTEQISGVFPPRKDQIEKAVLVARPGRHHRQVTKSKSKRINSSWLQRGWQSTCGGAGNLFIYLRLSIRFLHVYCNPDQMCNGRFICHTWTELFHLVELGSIFLLSQSLWHFHNNEFLTASKTLWHTLWPKVFETLISRKAQIKDANKLAWLWCD